MHLLNELFLPSMTFVQYALATSILNVDVMKTFIQTADSY